MKFKEYMEIRGKNTLSKKEREIIGLDFKKGWLKDNAEIELSDLQVNKLITAVLKSDSTPGTMKVRMQSIQKNYEVTDEKLLYLMVSGNKAKIGISKDPHKRSRSLTTSSGELVEVLAIWKLSDLSRKIESQLHKEFQNSRLEGEWFTRKSITPELVERAVPCDCERIYYNHSLDVETAHEVTETKKESNVIIRYSEIKRETEKAIKVDVSGLEYWFAKSTILLHDTLSKTITHYSWAKPSLATI